MKRREFITLMGGAAAAWPLAARAQEPKVWRIGFLGLGSASAWAPRVAALRAGLRELGYDEGKSFVIEFGWAETADQLHERAAGLFRGNVDVIFATSSTEVGTAQQATRTIPIVFGTHAGIGHVAAAGWEHYEAVGGANRPHCQGVGDIQGSRAAGDAVRRTLQSHRAFAPSYLQSAEVAGTKLGVQIELVTAQAVEDFEGAFATSRARSAVSPMQ
jgi:putative tryptophan/tyrosine transport system substrate-binding protein